MKKLILLLLFIPFLSFSQDYTLKVKTNNYTLLEDKKRKEETIITIFGLDNLNTGVDFTNDDLIELLNSWMPNVDVYYLNKINLENENLIIRIPPYQMSSLVPGQYTGILTSLKNSFKETDIQLVDSGLGKFKDKFPYLFLKTILENDGLKRFSSTYFLYVKDKTYHIVINSSLKAKNIQDVILEIYEYE